MSDFTRSDPMIGVRRTDWGAIWAGMFTFVAIWAVFGILGEAIFASVGNPNAARLSSGMSVGMGVWSIVLTIIAMYVAGRETGRLAGVTNRRDGLIHGMVPFGLSVVATLVVAVLAGSSLAGTAAIGGVGVQESVRNLYILTVISELGWVGFVALSLGWLAAMAGASQSVANKAQAEVRDIRRPAA